MEEFQETTTERPAFTLPGTVKCDPQPLLLIGITSLISSLLLMLILKKTTFTLVFFKN